MSFEKIIIGFAIAIILYNILDYIVSLNMIDKGYKQTMYLVDTLIEQAGYATNSKIIEKNNLSEVWGRNIYAYEYVFKYSDNIDDNNKMIKDIIAKTEAVNKLGKFNHKMVITDYFILHQKIHMDFAYLLNVSTYEYVLDMEHLEHIN